MIGTGIFFLGERGFHVLFDVETIEAAFEEDLGALREVVSENRGLLEAVLEEILGTHDAGRARARIARLEPALQHVLVHLYFELLEQRMRAGGARLH